MTGEQVLVVEDNEKNMKLFRDVLIATGFRTLEATTGGEAVDLASEHTPDLVLMDIQLPDIDGVQALHRLRADARTATIPVLALTAQAMRGIASGSWRRGSTASIEARERAGADHGRPASLRGAGRMSDGGRILVVDDVPPNVRLLEAVLAPRGYDVISATDGARALELVASVKPDLVMLDVVMPQPDGYAVCRRIREREDTAMLPVIMITASTSERIEAIRAGADDLIAKPFDRDELLARVRSLLRIKRYHDTITSQAAELTELNRTLEERVQTQVVELERVRKLRRFLSPQLVDAIVSSGDDAILRSHRRKVAMLFADLRGWTNFVDAVEPEELMQVLGEFHSVIGGLVRRFDATVGFLEGDGVQLFFNDPQEIPDAPLRAVRLACALREEMAEVTPAWRKRGYELGLGVGVALGYATCGEVGFEGRSDYAAIGAVTNLASRLADEAAAGQVLIAQGLYSEIETDVDVEPVREFILKGFQRPVAAFSVIAVSKPTAPLSSVQSS